MKVSNNLLVGGLTFGVVVGLLVGFNLALSPSPQLPSVPVNIEVVSDPSEFASPTPNVTPSPRVRPSYVPPRLSSPDPSNPEAGGNVGGNGGGVRPTATRPIQ